MMMRAVLHPRWIWIFNTLPSLLLMGLMGYHYQLIKPLLSEPTRQIWGYFAGALVLLQLATAGYALWQTRRRRELPVGYGAIALAGYTAFVWTYLKYSDTLLPFSLPQWLATSALDIYPYTFLMPALAHALLVLIAWSVPTDTAPKASQAAWSLIFVGGVLACVFVSFSLNYDVGIVVVVVLAFLVLFGVGRAAYVMAIRRHARHEPLAWGWRLLVALLMPLAGLAVNCGFWSDFANQLFTSDRGIFGNFNSWEFWTLAVVNGVLLLLPSPGARLPRLLLAVGRAALLPFTGYFFLVLLPFLPLSIFAILGFGIGLLLLTPILLLPLHLTTISGDAAALARAYRRPRLTAALLGGSMLLLPLAVIVRDLHHRHTLHQALAQVLNPDYAAPAAPLDAASLRTTLRRVRDSKVPRFGGFDSRQQPYLTELFNWLVLDNLSLPDARLRLLEQVYLGAPAAPSALPGLLAPPAGARLAGVVSRSTYDPKQQAWRSQLELTVAARDTGGVQDQEYVTTIALPPGTWVSDYYLDINGHRETGILAESKAAAWVYSQIVGSIRPQDPGLLKLQEEGEKLALRVFPVTAGAGRHTGFTLLHKEPIALHLDDDRTVLLGDSSVPAPAAPVGSPDGQALYVSARAKQALPLVRRQPYFHFLLDVSNTSEGTRDAAIERIEKLLARQPALATGARFTLVNAYAQPLATGVDWRHAFRSAPAAGGYYAAGAMRQALALAARRPEPRYPVVVLVTDFDSTTLSTALVADKQLLALQRLIPEPVGPYALTNAQPDELTILGGAAAFTGGQSVAVRVWPARGKPQAYLPDDGQASIVVAQPDRPVKLPAAPLASQVWTSGLILAAHHRSTQLLHPQLMDVERPAGVRASFQAGLLTPVTSWLALENETQKIALHRKQEQVLNGNVNLAAGEDDITEGPPANVPLDGGLLWLTLAGIALGIGYLRRAA
jgi:hypothetical protein